MGACVDECGYKCVDASVWVRVDVCVDASVWMRVWMPVCGSKYGCECVGVSVDASVDG